MEPNNSKYMDAARDALTVQSASNLSGIILSMVRHVEALNVRKRLIGQGTDWFNTHPIMYLFSVQIGYLTGTAVVCDDSNQYSEALRVCELIAKGEIPQGY